MANDVRTQSAEAEKLNEDCALIDALLGGTKAMRAAGKTHLPQWPGESDETYDCRIAITTLFPAYQRTIEVLASKPFSKPLTYGADVPPTLVKLCENVDRMGRNLHSFLSEIGQRALGYGMGGILVDFPSTMDKDGNPLYKTVADETAAKLQPYMVEILPKNILGWLPTNPESVDGLTQLRILESVTEPDGEFHEKQVEQVRVLGKGTWQTWRKQKVGDKEQWALYQQGVTTLSYIPFVAAYGNRLGFMQARPALLELAHANVEHWQSKSDQQNILHVARVPILFAKMLGEKTAITVGTGSAVKSEDKDGDLKFVEHNGKAIEAGRSSLLDLEDRMRQAGAELLIIKPGNVTEAATVADNEQGACALKKVANNLEDAANQALQYMADWIKEPTGGHIQIFKDFGAATLAEASAELLLKMNVAGSLSDESLYEEMQRRGIRKAEVDWDTEKERITSQGPNLPTL